MQDVISNRIKSYFGDRCRRLVQASSTGCAPEEVKKNKMPFNEKVDLTIAWSWALGRMVWMGWLGVFSCKLKQASYLVNFFSNWVARREVIFFPHSHAVGHNYQLPQATCLDLAQIMPISFSQKAFLRTTQLENKLTR